MRTLAFASCLAAALAACRTTPSDDIVGPFTGPHHRYIVDAISPQLSAADARAVGDDLNGDGYTDNELGQVLVSLHGQNDAATHAADMIAAGVIASSVDVQADDLVTAPRAGVSYFGADGDPAAVMGGAFSLATFRSNRSATTDVPGRATVTLPVFADADPSRFDLEDMEIDLQPDGDGWIATVRGGIPSASASVAASLGIRQMIATDPQAHAALGQLLDADHDGVVSDAEVTQSDLVRALLAPDLTESGLLSAGFRVHLSPCPAGDCATGAPADPCHDRVRDGDETDVDCGGATCGACASDFACAAPTDCQTGACDGGRCAAATCTDARQDGFETGLDCGGRCGGCVGDVCSDTQPCAHATCVAGRCAS